MSLSSLQRLQVHFINLSGTHLDGTAWIHNSECTHKTAHSAWRYTVYKLSYIHLRRLYSFLLISLSLWLFFFQKPLTPVTSNHATGWAFPFAAITPGYTRLRVPVATTTCKSLAMAGNAPAVTSLFTAGWGNAFLDLLLSRMSFTSALRESGCMIDAFLKHVWFHILEL